MNNEKNNKNLVKWRELQETGEAKADKLGLDSEEKIVESLQIVEPEDFVKILNKII